MSQPIAVLGHGPVAETIAAALMAAGWPVTHVVPQPLPKPFALPLHCPIPQLSKLNAAQPALAQPITVEGTPTTIAPHPESTLPWLVELDTGARLEAAHVIIASSKLAGKLLGPLGISLPLRPARAHQLTFPGITAEQFGESLATHLGYGTIAAFAHQTDAGAPVLDVVYDGLADPTQATFHTEPDTRVAHAISSWLAKHRSHLIPLPQAEISTWSLATTPDYMPIIGPWMGTQVPKGLHIVAGYAAWGPVLATGLAQVYINALGSQQWPAELAFTDPTRFAEGRASAALKPIWLIERDNPLYSPAFAGNVRLLGGKAMSFMNNVQLVGSGPPEYAHNVQMTGKTIQHPASTRVREVGSRNIRMGGVR